MSITTTQQESLIPSTSSVEYLPFLGHTEYMLALYNSFWYSGVLHLFLMAVNRYVNICYPEHYARLFSRRRTTILMAIGYAMGMAAALPALLPCCAILYDHRAYAARYQPADSPYMALDLALNGIAISGMCFCYTCIIFRCAQFATAHAKVGIWSEICKFWGDRKICILPQNLHIFTRVTLCPVLFADIVDCDSAGRSHIRMMSSNRHRSCSVLVVHTELGIQLLLLRSFRVEKTRLFVQFAIVSTVKAFAHGLGYCSYCHPPPNVYTLIGNFYSRWSPGKRFHCSCRNGSASSSRHYSSSIMSPNPTVYLCFNNTLRSNVSFSNTYGWMTTKLHL